MGGGVPAFPGGMGLGNRKQPEPSAFLTCLHDLPGEADQASRSAPAKAVIWLRLGRWTRLSDPGLATSRRELRQRGGREATASHGVLFCRALSFLQAPLDVSLLCTVLAWGCLLWPGGAVSGQGVFIELRGCPANSWLPPQISPQSEKQITHLFFVLHSRRRKARRKGSWRNRRQRKSCPASKRR